MFFSQYCDVKSIQECVRTRFRMKHIMQDHTWLERYQDTFRCTRMTGLSWARLEVTGRNRPVAREGHAMCAIDDNHALVFGGFGQGIRNDVRFAFMLPYHAFRFTFHVKFVYRIPVQIYSSFSFIAHMILIRQHLTCCCTSY